MSDEHTVPIIKIEIETMRQTMHHAFSKQLLQLDEQFQKALDAVCAPENIQAVLDKEVRTQMEAALHVAVENYFRKGPGWAVVRDEVCRRLDAEFGKAQPNQEKEPKA